MSIIRPRSEWTSTAEGFSYALRADTVTGFAIHYPGIGNVTTAGRSDEWAKQQLRNYRAYHVGTRGWADIGYNIAISQNGTAWWAAGKKKAAHCASESNRLANARHVGILLIIGNTERPTPAMLSTLNRVLSEVQAMYPGARTILGHREVPGASTACPGDLVVSLIHNGTIRPTAATPGGVGGGMSPVVVPAPAPAPTPAPTPSLFPLLVDGDWGPITTKGLQTRLGRLLVDGHFGPVTVKRLQAYLGGLYVDGDFGPKTKRALQARLGVVVDGWIGPVTVKALQTRLNRGAL